MVFSFTRVLGVRLVESTVWAAPTIRHPIFAVRRFHAPPLQEMGPVWPGPGPAALLAVFAGPALVIGILEAAIFRDLYHLTNPEPVDAVLPSLDWAPWLGKYYDYFPSRISCPT